MTGPSKLAKAQGRPCYSFSSLGFPGLTPTHLPSMARTAPPRPLQPSAAPHSCGEAQAAEGFHLQAGTSAGTRAHPLFKDGIGPAPLR